MDVMVSLSRHLWHASAALPIALVGDRFDKYGVETSRANARNQAGTVNIMEGGTL